MFHPASYTLFAFQGADEIIMEVPIPIVECPALHRRAHRLRLDRRTGRAARGRGRGGAERCGELQRVQGHAGISIGRCHEP